MSSLAFSLVLFTLLAYGSDISSAATAPSTSPLPPPPVALTAETMVSADEIRVTGVDLKSQLFPSITATKATCGRLNIPKLLSTASKTGNYVLVKVTPTSNSFPTPTGLNTCSPYNFINGECGATRVVIDDTFIPMKFSTYASNNQAPTSHYAANINRLGPDPQFPFYQGKVTTMEERAASGQFVSVFPIPSQVQITQEVPFAIITNDEDFAWIAFVTCDVNNPLTWVIIKEELIASQQQFDAYQNAFNQALSFSGVNTGNMIDIPITDYNQASSLVSNTRLNINFDALSTAKSSTFTTNTSPSSSPSPP